jgi:hypothetical protein
MADNNFGYLIKHDEFNDEKEASLAKEQASLAKEAASDKSTTVLPTRTHILAVDIPDADEYIRVSKAIGWYPINHLLATHHHYDHAGGMVGVTKDLKENVEDNSYLEEDVSPRKAKSAWTNKPDPQGPQSSDSDDPNYETGCGNSHRSPPPQTKMRRTSSNPLGFRMVNHIGFNDVEKTRPWIKRLNELGVNLVPNWALRNLEKLS